MTRPGGAGISLGPVPVVWFFPGVRRGGWRREWQREAIDQGRVAGLGLVPKTLSERF